MDFVEMYQYLLGSFQANGYNPRNVGYNTPLHTETIVAQVVHPATIEISFPGYKSVKNHRYDYLVKLYGNNVAHIDIMYEINGQITRNPDDAHLMEELIIDIAHNWENIDLEPYRDLVFTYFTLEEFVECVCYISLQEEFNYPQELNYDGFRRPFYSYLEALYSAIYRSIPMFHASLSRCRAGARFIRLDDPNIPYDAI